MSFTLEFHSLAWQRLGEALRSADLRLARGALQRFEGEEQGVYAPADFGGGPDVGEGILRWVRGTVGAEVNSLGERLAFLALVRQLGEPAGTLGGAGGMEQLRARVLAGPFAAALPPGIDASWILERPVCGHRSGGLPLWGGLAREELLLLADLLEDGALSSPDPDVDTWLADLASALESALARGHDLVTLSF